VAIFMGASCTSRAEGQSGARAGAVGRAVGDAGICRDVRG
jgi:hypothetical protein